MSTKPATALLGGDAARSSFLKESGASAEQHIAGDVGKGVATNEMSISGNKVLLALAIAFLLTNGLIWAFVRYWLFAP